MGRHSQGDNGVSERREQMAETYNGYCVKCREKRDFEGEVVELANGSKAAQGSCPVCGTKMTRMLPKSAKVQS
jgi:hypothetical protein